MSTRARTTRVVAVGLLFAIAPIATFVVGNAMDLGLLSPILETVAFVGVNAVIGIVGVEVAVETGVIDA